MSVESIKKEILNYMTEYDRVTFKDIKDIDGCKGKLAFGFPENNIYWWFDMSTDFVDAIHSLNIDGIIDYEITKRISYIGCIPQFHCPKGFYYYKEPHWLPVFIIRGLHFRLT